MTHLCQALTSENRAVALAAACNLVYARRLVTSLSGNASCRVPAGFLCTPTGFCLGEVTATDLVALDAAWRPMSDIRLPSSEWRLHAAIYRALPAAGAVVHTHSRAATLMAVLGRDIAPLTPEMDHFLGNVPCLPFAPPGTDDVGAGVARAINAGARAVLLGSHGAVVWARDVRLAYYQAELLEASCSLTMAVTLAGGTRA